MMSQYSIPNFKIMVVILKKETSRTALVVAGFQRLQFGNSDEDQNNIIIDMKKEKAKEYFQQLKKQEQAKPMTLAQVIDLITGGAIGLDNTRLFIQQTLQGQTAKYNQILGYLSLDWRQLQFEEIYLILKCLKDYFKRQRILTESKINSQTDLKDAATSFHSRQQNKRNKTLEQIMRQMSRKEGLIRSQPSDQPLLEERLKQMRYKVLKKLLVVFDYLRKMMQLEGESFEKKRQMCQKLDLNMFMRYIKLFEIGFVFRSDRIIKSFKDNALNHLWLDFDRFVSTNFQMIGLKEDTPHKDKYMRLRGLSEILASDRIRKVLNVGGKTTLATIVEGQIGTYKQDIINHLNLQSQKRPPAKINRQRLKTQVSQSKTKQNPQKLDTLVKNSQTKSAKVISTRAKTLEPIQKQQNLKLPSIKMKPGRSQSIYQSLGQLDLKKEEQKLRRLVNVQENQQYLNEYLDRQARLMHIRNITQPYQKEAKLP